MSTFKIPELIAKKRDGGELTQAEIEFFINGTVREEISKEQIGAMLMAIYLKGMTNEETVHLTRTMMLSGDVLTWPDYPSVVVDKHSTGGVGDKISLPLAPALAALGLKVPMISGRGLGHTGGTLDKLESIPGYNVSQSLPSMHSIIDSVGCCIVGQTKTLVPGDRIIYAIRDVTATVASIPLITSSIISKKVAEGLSSLVLDVKVGKAAFMKTLEEAEILANSMVAAGKGNNVNTVAVLTAMDNPIGRLIGNSLEVIESVEVLQGKGPNDLIELTIALGAELLVANGNAPSTQHAVDMISATFKDGTALSKFNQMLVAQGVEVEIANKVCNDPWNILPIAVHRTFIHSHRAGFVSSIDAYALAIVASDLGAGRQVAEDKIDFGVGLRIVAQAGEEVVEGGALVEVFHTGPLSASNSQALLNAFILQDEKPNIGSRIIKVIRS